MSNTSFPNPIISPPITRPVPPDVWLCRRYGISPATARIIAELAWPAPATWIGGSH